MDFCRVIVYSEWFYFTGAARPGIKKYQARVLHDLNQTSFQTYPRMFEGRCDERVVRVYLMQTGYKGRPVEHGFVLHKRPDKPPAIACNRLNTFAAREDPVLVFPFMLVMAKEAHIEMDKSSFSTGTLRAFGSECGAPDSAMHKDILPTLVKDLGLKCSGTVSTRTTWHVRRLQFQHQRDAVDKTTLLVSGVHPKQGLYTRR